MSERKSYLVVNHEGGWAIKLDGRILGTFATQEDAEAVARDMARDQEPSQVRVQGKDGKWQDESTYGDDPYPPKG